MQTQSLAEFILKAEFTLQAAHVPAINLTSHPDLPPFHPDTKEWRPAETLCSLGTSHMVR
jgi:hypothetical protein